MLRDMEQDPPCQECGHDPASYCWARDRYLCADCRRRWTEKETRDGGRHPVLAACSCENCREARIAFARQARAAAAEVTIAPGGPEP